MRIIDYHLHSTHSFDGKDAMYDICQRAVATGIEEICFTEHFSVDPRDVTFGTLQPEAYEADLAACREEFAGRLIIRKGLEIGEPHLAAYRAELDQQVARIAPDFILGSVHNMDSVKLRLYVPGKSKQQIYDDYFAEVYKMVSTADIDSIGHLDLAKKYAYAEHGNYHWQQHEAWLRAILLKAIERGIAIEINAAGLKANAREQYPAFPVLSLYRQLGGELITVGSDAHSADAVGAAYRDMTMLLREAGFTAVFTYQGRQATAQSIV